MRASPVKESVRDLELVAGPKRPLRSDRFGWSFAAGHWADVDEANDACRAWCVEVNTVVHSTIAAVPEERLAEERGLLRGPAVAAAARSQRSSRWARPRSGSCATRPRRGPTGMLDRLLHHAVVVVTEATVTACAKPEPQEAAAQPRPEHARPSGRPAGGGRRAGPSYVAWFRSDKALDGDQRRRVRHQFAKLDVEPRT